MADSVEGKAAEANAEAEDIKPDASGKYPETVPWNQYVATKETIGKKLDTATKSLETATTKVQSLEEQIKTAVTTEDHKKITDELEETKTKLVESSKELITLQDKSTSERKEILVKSGLEKEVVDKMTDAELGMAGTILQAVKPKLDLGGGGGGDPNRPATAKGIIGRGWEALHPSK